MLAVAPTYRCDAPHDDSHKSFQIQFKTFKDHADKHLPKNKERWEQLIPEWTGGDKVSAEDALRYLELTYKTVSRCFGLPRYVHGYDFEPRASPSSLPEHSRISARIREWKKPNAVLYFGCYDTGLLVCAVVQGSQVYIRTSHRIGGKNDTLDGRIHKLKKRVLRMTCAEHEEHLMVPLRWYSVSSWALPEDE